MKKSASILDYSMPMLDPAVWDQDTKLFAYQKDFILRLISKVYETYAFKQPELWVDDIVIIGSLTTNKWLFTSDMDVHARVNLAKFIETNMPGATSQEAFDKLDSIRKEFDRAKILAPMTQHPVEFYFEAPEFVPSTTVIVGVYSVLKDTWLKEPYIFPADLDFEESKKDVILQAEALAEELDGSLGKIQRDIKRIDEIEVAINAWDASKQQLFYAKVEQKLAEIEAEILKDVKIKQDLVDARHAEQNPLSDTEIKFKWLARFGFFGILQNLKNLLKETGGQITTQELPLVEKIISQGSIKEASDYNAWWIDPNGKAFNIDVTHDDWVADQWKMLRDQYGYKDIEQFFKNTSLEFWEIREYLLSKGWSRIGDLSNGNFGVQVNDLLHVPNSVFDFLLSHQAGLDKTMFEDANGRWISVPNDELVNGQKAVNKALSGKRMGSIKAAFLKEAFEEGETKETDTDICVDFDRTIAKPAKHPDIGEPIEGAKESLAKLKELGYNVIIYSCRGDDEEGLKAMEEWLDKHDMPYDSIFSGEKPFFKYVIDDRAIHFDSWDKVMQKVEKSNKTASSSVLKVEPYGGGEEFTVLVNPSRQQVARSLPQTVGEELRVIQGNNSYIWDSMKATHDHVLAYLIDQGLEDTNVQTGYVHNPFEIDEWTWKKASLSIVADPVNLPTIDPKTLGRKEPYALFIGTGDYGSAGKIDMFNVYGEHPMITKSNALPTVTLDTLIQNNIPVIGKEPRAGEKQPFQDISGIVKKAYSSIGTNKFWITPDQKIIKIGQSEMHVDWIAHHLNQLANMGVDVEDLDQPFASYKGRYFDDLSDNDQATLEHIMDGMQSNGWTRITSDDARTQFTIDGGKLGFSSGADQFIAEHFDPNDPRPIGVGWRGGDYLEIADPFPTISQAYAKASKGKGRRAAFSKLDLEAKTKKVKQGDYSCLMALVPHELAQEIVEWGVRNVPDGELYLNEDGKFGRELEPHVTIKYGLLTNDAKYVRRSFNEDKPFHAKLGKVRHFEPPELPFDVLTIEVISEDLNKANAKVCKKFDCAKGLVSDEYKSHITIAYMKRGKAKDYIGHDGFDGKEVDLDTVIFSPRKGNRTYFSISNDKESAFILEEMNKFGSMDIGYWVDPKGSIYDVHGGGMIHNEWVLANLEMLEKDYGIKVPESLYNERLEYYKTLETEDDNVDMPSAGDVWTQMIQSGWVRVGDADEGIGIEVNDLRKIPPFMDNLLAEDLRDGLMVRVEDIGHTMISVQYPFKNLQQAVNEALVGQSKYASGDNFLPSLFNAPDNNWQFEHGGDDKEIALNPDPVSDETTWYAPCTEGKPRTKEVWRQFMSIFRNPFSKKEEMTVDSAYDPELEQKEKDALGEDETLLEYSKGFYDPKKHDFPHNTTWDSLTQDGEPSKPTSVTYSPESNDVFLDQNSPGGYPRRFMGKPKGEWFSDEGEIVPALQNMWKYRKSSLNKKKASQVKDIDGVRVYINPNQEDLSRISKNFHKEFMSLPSIRALIDPKTGDIYAWDAWFQEHTTMDNALGLENSYHWDGSWDELDHLYAMQEDIIMGSNRKFSKLDITAITRQYALYIGGRLAIRTLTRWKALKICREKFPEAFAKGDYQIAEESYKVASIEEVDDIPVLVNPSPEEVKGFLKKFKALRALVDPETGAIFAWDAYKSEHDNMIRYFGLPIDWETDDGTYIRHVTTPNDIEALFVQQLETQEKLRRKKKASIENVDGIKVLVNPSRQEMEGLARTLKGNRIRGLIDPHSGDLFVWDAYFMEHIPMISALGLDLKYDMDSPYVLYFPPSQIDEMLARPRELVQKKRVAKQAGQVVDVEGVRVYKNPSFNQTKKLFENSQDLELRFMVDPITSDLYVWDAYLMEHWKVWNYLGLKSGTEVQQGHLSLFPDDIETLFKSLNKTAGDQSASVPDYLINEWKTDQINNDTDEEPYVNHDQRDYPYGMHDSPENTGYNIGWPKDNQPYVVRLDILENPAYRLDPFGIGEYNVTWYESLPAGDGIEATNPD